MSLRFKTYKDINFSIYYPLEVDNCKIPLSHDIPIKEIFYDKIYERYFAIEDSDTVMDLGSHIGVFSMRALLQGAKHVYCFEPEVTYYNALKYNLSWFPNDTITIKNDFATSKSIIDAVMRSKKKYNFWKIDIEGYEFEILENPIVQSYLLKHVNKMAIEFHINCDENLSDRMLQIYNIFDIAGWNYVITDVNGMCLTEHFNQNYWYSDKNTYAKSYYNQVLGYIWQEL